MASKQKLPMPVKDFIKFVDENTEKGNITSEEKDEIIYDCAYAQSYDNNLGSVMSNAIEKIKSIRLLRSQKHKEN